MMSNDEHFSMIMDKMLQLREALVEQPEQDDTPFRYMATVTMYLGWIVDDLLAIFLASHVRSARGRFMIRGMRAMLSILEETNRHAVWAHDILEAHQDKEDAD